MHGPRPDVALRVDRRVLPPVSATKREAGARLWHGDVADVPRGVAAAGSAGRLRMVQHRGMICEPPVMC
jgi:hypothetical protein